MTTDFDQLQNFAFWLRKKSTRSVSDLTISAYLSDVRQFSRWVSERIGTEFDLRDLTSFDLSAYADSCLAAGAKASTWNRRRTALRLFCRFLVESGQQHDDQFRGVVRMIRDPEAPKSMSQQEFYRFMRAADRAVASAHTDLQRQTAIRNRALIAVLGYAGLRVSEARELCVSDLLLSDRIGELTVRRGKGNKQSTAYLQKNGRTELRAWLEIRPQTLGALVFGAISSRQAERIVSEIAREAGIETAVTPHTLRHTYIYRIWSQTHDINLCKSLGRHSRAEQTLRYAMPHKSDLIDALDSLAF